MRAGDREPPRAAAAGTATHQTNKQKSQLFQFKILWKTLLLSACVCVCFVFCVSVCICMWKWCVRIEFKVLICFKFLHFLEVLEITLPQWGLWLAFKAFAYSFFLYVEASLKPINCLECHKAQRVWVSAVWQSEKGIESRTQFGGWGWIKREGI